MKYPSNNLTNYVGRDHRVRGSGSEGPGSILNNDF